MLRPPKAEKVRRVQTVARISQEVTPDLCTWKKMLRKPDGEGAPSAGLHEFFSGRKSLLCA
ncbi:hypothetical protein KSP39_PZI010495 [Platanthera zijinensis]|uniref:Uncharacterized protein n=1 Tax=Platanthera zijinensis TaxID=2320716 RepID=A0AAP0BK93_9ASPA